MADQSEYQRGFSDGWKAAADAVWLNRNHHRAMSGYAPETQAEAMARIYSVWPAPPPPVLTGAEDKLAKEPIKRTVDVILDSIDLYVVLPENAVRFVGTPPSGDR